MAGDGASDDASCGPTDGDTVANGAADGSNLVLAGVGLLLVAGVVLAAVAHQRGDVTAVLSGTALVLAGATATAAGWRGREGRDGGLA